MKRFPNPFAVRLFENRYIPFIFVICAIIAGGWIYLETRLPDSPAELIEMLAVNDVPTHFAVGHKLMRYGKKPFLVAIRHHDYRIRGRAAHFLGLLHDRSVLAELVEASNDPNEYVRNRVAFALGELGDPRALSTLERLAEDTDQGVRDTAREAIQKLEVKNKIKAGEQKRGRESFIDSQEGHVIKAISCRGAHVFPPVDWPTIF